MKREGFTPLKSYKIIATINIITIAITKKYAKLPRTWIKNKKNLAIKKAIAPDNNPPKNDAIKLPTPRPQSKEEIAENSP